MINAISADNIFGANIENTKISIMIIIRILSYWRKQINKYKDIVVLWSSKVIEDEIKYRLFLNILEVN